MKYLKIFEYFMSMNTANYAVPYPTSKEILGEPKNYTNTQKRVLTKNNFNETEQYSNIHTNEEGQLIGNCKLCNANDISIYGHYCPKKQSNTKHNVASYYDFVLNPARSSRDLSEFESIFNDVRDYDQNYSNTAISKLNYSGPTDDNHYRNLFRSKDEKLFGDCKICNCREVLVSEHNKICKSK